MVQLRRLAARDAGIVTALRVDACLHGGPGDSSLPDVGTGQERVSFTGDLLGVPGQKAHDEAGHGKVMRVAQQRRYQGGQRCPLLEPLVGDPLDGHQRAHARVRADAGAPVPRPHVLVTERSTCLPDARNVQLDSGHGAGVLRFAPAAGRADRRRRAG